MLNKSFIILILLLWACGCVSSKLPTKYYSHYSYGSSYSFKNNTLTIELKNPLLCPLRVWVKSNDTNLRSKLDSINPIVLKPNNDTIIRLVNLTNNDVELTFTSLLGDPSKLTHTATMELPFLKNKTYRIIQGNNTNHTHSTEYSKYAVDFNLKVNDTICSATSGFVVSKRDNYKYGGTNSKWRPFSNFITIYEPESGIFTQYVHLVHKGSLVQIGDIIEIGQPIALSGETGWTDTPHLHFNTLIPVNTNTGLKSIPFQLKVGYNSQEFKKNDLVTKGVILKK